MLMMKYPAKLVLKYLSEPSSTSILCMQAARALADLPEPLLLANVTVNLENFARILFSRNFSYAKFRENKILTKS